MINDRSVLDSFKALIDVADGDHGASDVARKFLVSIWRSNPFDIMSLSKFDNENCSHTKRILDYMFKYGFHYLMNDFEYSKDMERFAIVEFIANKISRGTQVNSNIIASILRLEAQGKDRQTIAFRTNCKRSLINRVLSLRDKFFPEDRVKILIK
ncbi:unnamed protein product [Commensalibacter communis]|uniref:DUF7673 family protein n=1 Tax=Commensalibacter communis TaxID=2972786 RepID=UPI0022FFA247|nr:hypothetical protein [Commensalibacter communis]CAI3947678.1 unnamed protein product [Commensalibacter communis]